MPNLLLTTRCVRSCPYCFARREIEASSSADSVSWEDLIFLADFLEASGDRHISLLGGEPTLHRDFVDFVLYLHERGFSITVFTSGVLSNAFLCDLERYLRAVPPGPLSFVCNLNDPEQISAPPGETERVHEFLSVMGPWVSPGFNIHRPDFRLEFIIELVARYGLMRQLRLGIAHPVPGNPGTHVSPGMVRQAIDRLCSYRALFERFRIKPGLDCGFPLCQFSDEQLGWFHRLTGEALRFYCCPAIDIAPDMSVYSCFPLSRFHRRSIYEFDSMREVLDFYHHKNDAIRAELAGIFEECDGCIHREEGVCAGGGACHLLCRLTDEAPVRLPEIQRGLSDTRLP